MADDAFKMTESQEAHLARIQQLFHEHVSRKYTHGAKYHGGDLLDMGNLALVENAMDEAVDSYVYLSCIREKILGIKR